MSGLGRFVRAGVGRRRVQTVVMTVTTLLAVTASVLAAGLLVASEAPFRHAFDRLQGAHLTAAFDPTKVTPAQLAGTAHATGVTATAGPFPTLSVGLRTADGGPTDGGPTDGGPTDGGPRPPAGVDLPAVTVVGRASPAGPVDRLDITAGRWATGPGEIVWATDGFTMLPVGSTFTVPSAPGAPTLTVVGLARSIGQSAQAWVSPDQLAALGTPTGYEMLYRFAHAGTDVEIDADRAVIKAAAPGFTGASSYRTIERSAERTAGTFAPFVVAFGVLGLVMSVLIIGIVVSGAVGAATRRIGILKSLGFTPAQVARAYVAQALIPATVGALLGVAVGNLAAIPVLRQEGNGFGTGVPTLAPWVSVAVPIGTLILVAVTAVVPSLRAGRLRTVDAIAVGRTPAVGRGRNVRRALGRLPLPRSISLGLGNPFTRPGRSATIAAAVALGALGVTFGVGLATSLADIQSGLNRQDAGDVIVYPFTGPDRPGGPETPAPTADVTAAIEAQPGTKRYFSTGESDVTVAGLTGTARVVTFAGDASWASFQMISGRWFSAPGEAVVPTGFLAATASHIGDTVTLTTDEGEKSSVRIVGEVLDLHSDGIEVITDARSVPGVHPIDEYHIQLTAGTNPKAYVDRLNGSLSKINAAAQVNVGEISSIVVAMDTLAGTLTLLLVTVAGLGVLNTVVLDTRERVHDLGVFKALGMAPRQTIAMVLTSVGGIGLLAGLIGVPAGMALHGWVVPTMGHAAGTAIPPADIDVYHLRLLLPLAFGGLAIALAGALLPAGWAARTSTTRALRTE